MLYTPQDWYWIIGSDTSRAWSSAAGAYVTEWDLDRVTRIDTEQSLSDVLRPYGLLLPAPTQDDYASAVQAHIDGTARSKGYADGFSLASYVPSTVLTWQAEAKAFVTWRDAVWSYAYAQLAAVEAGSRPKPSISDLITELPAITWPA